MGEAGFEPVTSAPEVWCIKKSATTSPFFVLLRMEPEPNLAPGWILPSKMAPQRCVRLQHCLLYVYAYSRNKNKSYLQCTLESVFVNRIKKQFEHLKQHSHGPLLCRKMIQIRIFLEINLQQLQCCVQGEENNIW